MTREVYKAWVAMLGVDPARVHHIEAYHDHIEVYTLPDPITFDGLDPALDVTNIAIEENRYGR